MTLHTMLVMYYKRNDTLIDLTLREIYTDCIDMKKCGLFSRQEILKNKTLENYKVENIDFVNERVKIDLYNKHKCTKREFKRNLSIL